MAMAIGGEFDPDKIREKHLKQLAEDLKVTFPFFKRRYVRLVKKVNEALVLAHIQLTKEGFEPHTTLQHVLGLLRKYLEKRGQLL